VRYLADRLGKDIRLVLQGEGVAVAPGLRTTVRTALVQVVRNSADHGIEMPAVRARLGKPATGVIRVTARRIDETLVIEVVDDGRGIDPQRIRARALAAGMAGAARMDENDLLALIFRRGLTTAPYGGISGRGVGMTLARNRIAAAGGSITLASRSGRDTTVRVTLPAAGPVRADGHAAAGVAA
jgi:two-component system chemotaxis sensor kinase CheA